MNQDPSSELLLSRLDSLQHRLSSPSPFPYTKKLLNLDLYLKNNYNQFIRLQLQTSKLKKQTLLKFPPTISPPPTLHHLLLQNKQLSTSLSLLRHKNLQSQKQSYVPELILSEDQRVKLKTLEMEVYDMNIRVNYLRRKNKAYNDGMKEGDMFKEYENMIRELEKERKRSFEMAEEFKYYVGEINVRTGRNQNANTLLIHLK